MQTREGRIRMKWQRERTGIREGEKGDIGMEMENRERILMLCWLEQIQLSGRRRCPWLTYSAPEHKYYSYYTPLETNRTQVRAREIRVAAAALETKLKKGKLLQQGY